jgi:hypothetical protein
MKTPLVKAWVNFLTHESCILEVEVVAAGVHFSNILRAAFNANRSQKIKKGSQVISQSFCIKAASNTLVKLSPVVHNYGGG